MKPIVSIIMGSISDLPIMERAAAFLNDMCVPFEINALSAHRTPDSVEKFAKEAKDRGIEVIIAGAGMAAALPGAIAANTIIPVIGVPIKGMIDGLDAMLSMIQMPPGIPVATVGVNGSINAAILAIEILSLKNPELSKRLEKFKDELKNKTKKANIELKEIKYDYKTN
ncbi:MAG TPA: 5-(carboxyamino)imidazole ribonucleotide mutase [Bacteroidaceae bacterium]|nr:5-(carboxyamino)imidazole ribonucleotide mutase [Bacteroidaceae bacterium]